VPNPIGPSSPKAHAPPAMGALELDDVRVEYERSGATRQIKITSTTSGASLPLTVGPGQTGSVKLSGLDVEVAERRLVVNGYALTFGDDGFPSVSRADEAARPTTSDILANPPLPPAQHAPMKLPATRGASIASSSQQNIFSPLSIQFATSGGGGPA